VEQHNTHTIWLSAGGIVPPLEATSEVNLTDRALLQHRERVRITMNEFGSELSWVVFAPNWASLFLLRELIPDLPKPYKLRFFAYGWFEEDIDSAPEAINRIDELVAKSDFRVLSPVFIREQNPSKAKLTPDFLNALNNGEVSPAHLVTCEIDEVSERIKVTHVGEQSALASVWGKTTVAFPCLTGHSYDKVVSKPYFDVVKSGKPHYDHVLAAMTQPDGETRWFGYERLVLPGKPVVNSRPTVNVLCHRGPVDIRVP
jgi:hypothetical protein